MFRRIKAYIPNTITCLNLLSGALACVFAFYYDRTVGGMPACQWAFLFIGAAALFDFLDGAAARLLHAYSDMGKELDSLSDLVSFGLAPSVLVYSMMSYYASDLSFCPFVSLFIAVMGALRLAKFNVDTRQTTSFIGLPIPANALFWIGFVAWIRSHTYPGDLAVAAVVVMFSLLMVSNIRMFSLKFKNFGFKENYGRFVLMAAAVCCVLIAGIPGLAWTIVLYILMSVFNVGGCKSE